MSLIDKTDLTAQLYEEQIDLITRDNDALVTTAISRAEDKVKGYLSRFNISTLFSASGSERNGMLVGLCTDVAVWELITLANPDMNAQAFQERYEMAVSQLKDIQSGKHVPYQWPAATTPEGANTFFHAKSSQTKRETRW